MFHHPTGQPTLDFSSQEDDIVRIWRVHEWRARRRGDFDEAVCYQQRADAHEKNLPFSLVEVSCKFHEWLEFRGP